MRVFHVGISTDFVAVAAFLCWFLFVTVLDQNLKFEYKIDRHHNILENYAKCSKKEHLFGDYF